MWIVFCGAVGGAVNVTVACFSVLILVDVSSSNVTYLTHIQHSLRLLLQQQMTNKDYFNVIAYASPYSTHLLVHAKFANFRNAHLSK